MNTISRSYPSWCTIDPYDDDAARSSKRSLQIQYDKNLKCKKCKKLFRDHITDSGKAFKLGHMFDDVKGKYDYLKEIFSQ